MPDEIDFVLSFCLHILRSFGFTDFKAYLGTKPHDAIGEDSQWTEAEAALRASLDRSGLDYEIDAGGGAFYGPKIDLKVKDAIGREWQLSTNQFDFNLPERFDLTYIGEDGQQHRPYMVHRALMGSMERFFGILIEHYGGAFRFGWRLSRWLLFPSPTATSITPKTLSPSSKPRASAPIWTTAASA